MKILTLHTHESYQYELAKTGHEFYHLQNAEFSANWGTSTRPLPENIKYINEDSLDVSKIDLIMSHTFSQNMFLRKWIKDKPTIHLEHTAPQIKISQNILANQIVYITKYSKKQWNREKTKDIVIRHGLDINEWPLTKQTDERVLTMVNSFKLRDWCCGFSLYKEVTKNIPNVIVGWNNSDITPMPIPTTSFANAKEIKSSNYVYLNTSLHSPVPMSLLEAMACGMSVVTTSNCELPYYVQNKENGIISNFGSNPNPGTFVISY